MYFILFFYKVKIYIIPKTNQETIYTQRSLVSIPLPSTLFSPSHDRSSFNISVLYLSIGFILNVNKHIYILIYTYIIPIFS